MLSYGGQGTAIQGPNTTLSQNHPAGDGPRWGAEQEEWGQTQGRLKKAKEPSKARARQRMRSPTRNPLPFPPSIPRQTPHRFITGNPGLPRWLSAADSTLGALTPAPTHFRVQPPTSPPSPPLLPLPESRRPRTTEHVNRARSLQAAQSDGARPCANQCACARPLPYACSVDSPAALGNLVTPQIRYSGFSCWLGGHPWLN